MNMIYQNIDNNPMSNYFASFRRKSKSCDSNLDSNKCLIAKKSKTCEIDVKKNFKKASIVEGLDQRKKESKSRKGKKSSKRKHGSSSMQLKTLRTSKKSRISKKSSKKKKRKIKEKMGKEVTGNHCECTVAEIKCKNYLTKDDIPIESSENNNEEKKICGCGTLFGRRSDSVITNIDDDKKAKSTKEEKRPCSCNKENNRTNIEDCSCGVKNLISFECHTKGDSNTEMHDSVKLIKISLENEVSPRRKRGRSVSFVDGMKRSQISKKMSLENDKNLTEGKCIFPPSLEQRNCSKQDECPNVVYNSIPNPFIQWKRQRRFSKSVDACNCGQEPNEGSLLDKNCQENKKTKVNVDSSAQKDAKIEAEELNNTCLANCRTNNSHISIKSKKKKNFVQLAKPGKPVDTKPVKLPESKTVKPAEIKPVKYPEPKPLKLPEVNPAEIKPVKHPDSKPLKLPEPKPVKLAEIKPMRHSEPKPLKLPDPKPVKPAEIKSVKHSESKPVKPAEIKSVKQQETKPSKLPEPKPVKPAEIKPVKHQETKPLKLPEPKPVKPAEIKPVKHQETKPLKLPEPKPVKPAEIKPVKHPEPKPLRLLEPKPVKPTEIKPVKHPEPKPLKIPEPKPVKPAEIKPVKPAEPKPLRLPEPKPVKRAEIKPVKHLVKRAEIRLVNPGNSKTMEPMITFSKEMNIEKYKKCCGVYEPPVKFDNIPNYCYRDPLDIRLVNAWDMQTWCCPRRYGL